MELGGVLRWLLVGGLEAVILLGGMLHTTALVRRHAPRWRLRISYAGLAAATTGAIALIGDPVNLGQLALLAAGGAIAGFFLAVYYLGW
jgi:hypothetical protein